MTRSSALMLLSVAAFSMTACATPVTTLKNPKTGQVARCGGERSGSVAGGLIGYNMQKNDAEECVRDYEKAGFKKT